MLNRIFVITVAALCMGLNLLAQKPNAPRAPYIGAVIMDAFSGEILFEDHADELGSPASTLKLMTLLLVQERITAGKIHLDDMVKVSKEAYATGGSQVYLDPKEIIPVEDMLYALMIQSANDVAVALAEHVAGTIDAFVGLMNSKAKNLGMKNTCFATVNGLRPDAGKPRNVTTARDMAILAHELCRHPEVFNYTSATYRQFNSPVRKHPFDMRTHNPFLKKGVEGCDGFKTGYTSTAGWSIVVTCKRRNRRLNIVVLGSQARLMRDAEAEKLLAKGFAMINANEAQDGDSAAPARKFTPRPPPPPPLSLK
ncbi:MAG: D-alanyl-D-alanine carboxypeptidase [Kiritimatiellae bacterium]|jgi:D-alanyl-D-alanine carboxypeptidase (penicillin-binding protein 5/6)|nr:D-alanyl-D-alanine carboxypeptidase [Kiritimatiellia bacterium]